MPFTNPQSSITIPNGATTGPRIVIGTEVPAELYSASPFGLRIKSVILYFINDTDYSFEGVGTFGGISGTFRGVYSQANGLFVTEQMLDLGGAGDSRIARSLNGTTQIDRALTSNDRIYAASENASVEMTVGASTANAAFAIVPGAPSITFIKAFDESTLEYDLRLSNFANAANTAVQFAIRCSRVSPAFTQDTTVGIFLHNAAASQHMPFSSIRRNAASSVLAGTYQIDVMWRRASGAGTIFADSNDTWSLTVKEAL